MPRPRTFKNPVLFVHGYEPSGHAAAAHALTAFFQARSFDAESVNISKVLHPILGPGLAGFYFGVIKAWPGLWSRLYDNQALAGFIASWRRLYLTLEGRKLRAKIRELNPRLIVCTNALPLSILALEKQRRGLPCPLAACLTDYDAHVFWAAPETDLYFASSAIAARRLQAAGIAADRIKETGIPVHPVFSSPINPEAARRKLAIALDAPVLFLSGGGHGLGRLREIALALLARIPRARVLVTCGENSRLFHLLRGLAAREPRLRPFSRLEPRVVRDLMCVSDLMIGKPGGLTSAEAMVLGLPMIVFEPLPGQEERNADYLARGGAVLAAKSLEEAVALVSSLLGDQDRISLLRAKARALGRPQACAKIFEAVAELKSPGLFCYTS